MLFAACFCTLLNIPLVRADSWDDFSNNLASDLAPFLSLFGEQITKQYLSESITWLDYFIFAMAPMGILTAVVSAIRVCGSPSLRAFIGRAQEGGSNAEAELCSSTSRDVCELYNNGGIAKVFGRPKILEFVHDPINQDFENGQAGIYTFRDYVRSKNGKDEWEDEQKGMRDAEKDVGPDTFAPNLSLNVGIKRPPKYVFRAVATIGLILQAGVLVFAGVITYYLQWEKNGSRPESYACPLVIVGTLFVNSGILLCAFLVGQSTSEQIFRRKTREEKRQLSSIYWVQPGGQVLGDQAFDSFCYSDHNNHLNEYIRSWKNRSENWTRNSGLLVWAAVGITITGFILQFIGLRGMHSAVSIAQLGAIMVMSAARAALRMQRLKPEDNFLRRYPDEVVGHELDWLTLRIGESVLQDDLDLTPRVSMCSVPPNAQDSQRRYFWKFCGTPGIGDRIMDKLPHLSGNPNAAGILLAYRTRLAELTQSPNPRTNTAVSAEGFDVEVVKVRENANRLSLAIECAVNTIFSKSPKIRAQWENALSLYWGIACEITCKDLSTNSDKSNAATESRSQHTLYLKLRRANPPAPWRLEKREELEGLLGLWVWSLKSDPAVEISDLRSGFTLSRAAEIPARRIIPVYRQVTESDLKIWFGGAVTGFLETTLKAAPIRYSDVGTIWEEKTGTDKCHAVLCGELPETLSDTARFFGWHAMGPPQGQKPGAFKVLSAPAHSSLLPLCAQEVFGSFIKSMLDVVDDFGSIDFQHRTQHPELRNSFVLDLVRSFTENKLGTEDEALLCVLPPMISRLVLSSTDNVLAAVTKSADEHRKHNQWEEAETLLKWLWRFCSDPLMCSDASTGEPIDSDHTKRAAIALCELYRWALCESTTRKFGRNGIYWFSKTRESQSLHEDTIEIMDRYDTIAKGVRDHYAEPSNPRFAIPMVRNDRTSTLLYLTLWGRLESYNTKDRAMSYNTEYRVVSYQPKDLLCDAAANDWFEVVLTLAEYGAVVDIEDGRNYFKRFEKLHRTPLSFAAESGSINTVKALIELGASPDSADLRERTPLSYASEMGRTKVAEVLLRDKRVNPGAEDKDGRTPLSWATAEGQEEIVKQLLRTPKCRPDSKDNKQQTPLWHAAKEGHHAIVKLLLETGGVTPDAKDGWDSTPLHEAAAGSHVEIVRLLLDIGKAEPDPKDKYGQTPLFLATKEGSKPIVELLLGTRKVEPDVKVDNPPQTVRSYAEGYLLRANPHGKNPETPLLQAVRRGHEAIVKLLLNTGEVEPDRKDNQGQTPLFIAAKQGLEEIVKLLLGTGNVELDVEVNSPQQIGQSNRGFNEPNRPQTPLLLAVAGAHDGIVKLLLDKGSAGLDIVDSNGRTLLWLAVAGICERVENHEKIEKYERIFRLLLDTGKIDVNVKNNMNAYGNKGQFGTTRSGRNGWGLPPTISISDTSRLTPIWEAVDRGDDEMVNLLLNVHKADANSENPDGYTPLFLAIQRGDKKIVKLLLDLGKVDPSAAKGPGDNKWTPITWARAQRPPREDIVQMLHSHLSSSAAQSPLGLSCDS